MKTKNINILLLIAAVLFGSSCSEDFLELSPRTQQLEMDFYKTEKDMLAGLYSTYDVLQWKGFGGYTQIEMISDMLSDDAHVGGGGLTDQPSLQVLEDFTMTPTVSPNGIWGKYYKGIARANSLITALEVSELDKTAVSRVSAEVHFLRVYFYYQLWRFYGNVPLLKTVVTSGTVAQSSPDDIYAFLVSELDDKVVGKLPKKISDGEVGRVSNGAAIALKAKIVFQQNDDTKMGELVTELDALIADAGSYGYTLKSNYDGLFLTDNEFNAETVFEIPHSASTNWGDWGWLSGGEGNMQVIMTGINEYVGPDYTAGWGFEPVSTDLVAQYEAGDKRKDATIIDLSSFTKGDGDYYEGVYNGSAAKYIPRSNNTGYFQKKYTPRPENTSSDNQMLNYSNNMKVIRYSDVLLMAAEANLRAASGSLANAQTYFNKVRERAFGDTNHNTALTKDSAGLDIIYTERRVEFALEGQRYWDVLRTGKATSILGPLGWKSTSKYFPIPQSEIDKDKSLVQNDGYTG